MATTLVVDAYNAIYAIPEVRSKMKESLERARNSITLLSKEYARSSGYINDVRIVFDGDDRYRHIDALYRSGKKHEIFSKTGDGDDEIIRTVRDCSRYGKVVIASNDNYVRNISRGYGAFVINSEDLTKTKKRKKAIIKKNTEKTIDKRTEIRITCEYKKDLGLE